MTKLISKKQITIKYWAWTSTVMAIILVVYWLLTFIPIIGPYLNYPLQIVRCGKLPIIANEFGGRWYHLPSDQSYGPSWLTDHFFCSKQEAQAQDFNHE